MAQKVHVTLVDDLDQSEAAETVTFGLDGTTYEIDLSDNNAGRLRDSLASYVAAARRVSGGRGGRGRRAASGGGGRGGDSDTAKIREWARSKGMNVSDRGRIRADIRDEYYASH
jgi:hypothetical protein